MNMAKQLVDIDLPETSSSKKSEISIIPAKGDAVRRYNEAYDKLKDAEAVMKELRGELMDQGLEHIFQHNSDHADAPDQHIQSVRLQCVDPKDPDNTETLTVTWTKKSLKTVAERVKSWFGPAKTKAGKGADITQYAEWVVSASFDTDIFLDPKTGKFDTERYAAVQEALSDVAKRLKAEHPLSCTKSLKPTDKFHTKRFVDFTVDQNLALAEVLPTQITLEPVRTNGDKEDE